MENLSQKREINELEVAMFMELLVREIIKRQNDSFSNNKNFEKFENHLSLLGNRLGSADLELIALDGLKYRKIKDFLFSNLDELINLINQTDVLTAREKIEFKKELVETLKSEAQENVYKPLAYLLNIAIAIAVIGIIARMPNSQNALIINGAEQKVSDLYLFVYQNFGERSANILTGQLTDVAASLGTVPLFRYFPRWNSGFKSTRSEDIDVQLESYTKLVKLQINEPYAFAMTSTIFLVGLELLRNLAESDIDLADILVFLIPLISFIVFRGVESIQFKKN